MSRATMQTTIVLLMKEDRKVLHCHHNSKCFSASADNLLDRTAIILKSVQRETSHRSGTLMQLINSKLEILGMQIFEGMP